MAVPKLVGITVKKIVNAPTGLSLGLVAADPASRSLAFSTVPGTKCPVEICLDWDNPLWKEYSYANGILTVPTYTSEYAVCGIDLKYPWLYVSGTGGTSGILQRIDITTDLGTGMSRSNLLLRRLGVSYKEPLQGYVTPYYGGYPGPRYVELDTLNLTPLGFGPTSYWHIAHYQKTCNIVSFNYSTGSGGTGSSAAYFLKNPNGISYERIRRIRSSLIDPVGYPEEHVSNTAYDDLTDTCVVRYGVSGNTFALTKGFTAENLDSFGYSPAPIKIITIPSNDRPTNNSYNIPITCYQGWLLILGVNGIITAVNLETYEQLKFNVLPQQANQLWRELHVYPKGVLIAGVSCPTGRSQIVIAQLELLAQGNRYLNLSKPTFFIASGEIRRPGLDLQFPRWTGCRR